MGRRLRESGRFVEEQQLLGRRLQAIHPKRQALESDAAPETSQQEVRKHRLEVRLPVRAMRQRLLSYLLGMVAVADG